MAGQDPTWPPSYTGWGPEDCDLLPLPAPNFLLFPACALAGSLLLPLPPGPSVTFS
jgi:hypothetical protein